MEAFVSQTLLAEQKARARRSTFVFRLFAAGMLAVFVTMCLLTRTANARAMFIAMLASMIPAGIVCILVYCLRVRPDRAAVKHTKMLLDGETENAEGVLRFPGGPVQIPGSVRVLPVVLQDGEETRRLYLDEAFAGRMPEEGSRIRVRTVNRYITGAEVISGNETAPERNGQSKKKQNIVRRALSLFPAFVLWTMITVVFGGFVFNRITDTAPEHKVVIYADCTVTDGAVLADMLESALTAPVRMVKIHPCDYAMFGSEAIRNADLYIIPASHAAEYSEWLVPDGIPVYRPDGSVCVASAYFGYDPDEEYDLYYGSASLHTSGNEGAADNQAADVAQKLLEIH